MKNMYSMDARNSSTEDSRISLNQSLSNLVIKNKININENSMQPGREVSCKTFDNMVNNTASKHLIKEVSSITAENHSHNNVNEQMCNLANNDFNENSKLFNHPIHESCQWWNRGLATYSFSNLALNYIDNSIEDDKLIAKCKSVNHSINEPENENSCKSANDDLLKSFFENLYNLLNDDSETPVMEKSNQPANDHCRVSVNKNLKKANYNSYASLQNKPESEDLSKSCNQDLFNSDKCNLNKPLKSSTNKDSKSTNEKINELKYENCASTNGNYLQSKLTEHDLSKPVSNGCTSLNEIKHFLTKKSSKLVNEDVNLLSDGGLHNNNCKEISDADDCTSKYRNSTTPVYQDFMSNDIKKLWLKSTLSFIKNDNKESLKYPKIPLTEAVFIEAVVDQNFKPDSDNDFKTLYLSIREAMTIFKNKYEFLLKTVSKTNTTVHLSLEKVPKNNNALFKHTLDGTEKPQLSEKHLKKRNKKIEDKLAIIDSVPMPFVLDCLRKILAFVEDTRSASIVFRKMSPKEWTFIMNIKAIVKMRHMLVNDVSSALHKLLSRIAAHKDYGFNLALIGQDKNMKDRSVSLMKTPIFTACNKYHREVDNQSNCLPSPLTKRKIKCKELNPIDNNPSNILLRAITKPLKEFSSSETSIEGSLRSRPTSTERRSPEIKSVEHHTTNVLPDSDERLHSSIAESSNSSVERSSSSVNIAVYCPREDVPISENQRKSSAVKSYHTSIERTPATKAKTTIQFKRSGDSDALNVGSSSSKTLDIKNKCFRGRSLDRWADHMKTKLFEGLSVPLECEKAKRIMKLMGWNGGGLGTRGEGITEPIMPAISIVTGAGLGHTNPRNKNITKNDSTKSKTPPRSNIFSYQQYDEMSMCNPALAPWKLNKDVETRLFILSNILEFVLSNKKQEVLMFDIPLINNETDFLAPLIRSLNDGTDAALQTNFECGLFYKIQDAMVSKSELTLGAYLTAGGKNLQLLKLNENVVNDITQSEKNEYNKKYVSLDVYISRLGPKESYGNLSKKAFRLFAFRLMMLEEILEFLESNDVVIIYNIVTMLYKKHLKFMSFFIDNVNMRRREKSLTPHEDLVAEKIYNKLGDYCICFYVMRRHKQIKLQKKLRKIKDINSSTLKIFGLDKSNDLSNVKEKVQDKPIDKVQNTVREENQEKLEEKFDSENIVCKENNQQIEKKIQFVKESEEAYQIFVKEENKICSEQIDLSEESINLLKDIEELERSITKVHLSEAEFNNLELNSDSIIETNAKSVKTGELNMYKCFNITCKNPNEKITINSIRMIQNWISDAIDNCDSFLPLLQCNGIVDDKLSYSCYNKQTYLWIQTVIGDNYLIVDGTISQEEQYKMQIKLRTFIDDNSERVLRRIKLYNPELDVQSWKLEKKVVSIDFTTIDVHVDRDSFKYISEHNFSIFAGIDKAQFSVIWD